MPRGNFLVKQQLKYASKEKMSFPGEAARDMQMTDRNLLGLKGIRTVKARMTHLKLMGDLLQDTKKGKNSRHLRKISLVGLTSCSTIFYQFYYLIS